MWADAFLKLALCALCSSFAHALMRFRSGSSAILCRLSIVHDWSQPRRHFTFTPIITGLAENREGTNTGKSKTQAELEIISKSAQEEFLSGFVVLIRSEKYDGRRAAQDPVSILLLYANTLDRQLHITLNYLSLSFLRSSFRFVFSVESFLAHSSLECNAEGNTTTKQTCTLCVPNKSSDCWKKGFTSYLALKTVGHRAVVWFQSISYIMC